MPKAKKPEVLPPENEKPKKKTAPKGKSGETYREPKSSAIDFSLSFGSFMRKAQPKRLEKKQKRLK